MPQKSIDTIAVAQSYWDEHPDTTLIRVAFIARANLGTMKTWIARGFLVPPAQRAAEYIAVAPIQMDPHHAAVLASKEAAEEFRRIIERSADDEWDVGPVPTIESLRREIKRRMQVLIADPDSISKYATALGRLETVKEQERDSADVEGKPRVSVIYLPIQTNEPPPLPEETANCG